MEINFGRIFKNNIVFSTNNSVKETPNLVLYKTSL